MSIKRNNEDSSDGQRLNKNAAKHFNGNKRIVRANNREFNAQFLYADNYIKTTKYTLLTFLPLNLYEQFRRLANFYFLVLMCLQFIPQISSVVWYSTAAPLLFVLFVSAIKDGYDDVQRHKSDNQLNSRVSYLVRNGRLEEEQWMNVKVGDIVRMENEHFIAADLLLLSSSEPHGLCYIETAELDGETNLKCKCALPETSIMGDIVADIAVFDGEIQCEPPNNKLHIFEGRLLYKGQEYPLDNSRMLLRGCRLRNTRWCYGLVVFAGRDTKVMMNSGKTTLKRASLDRFLNLLILGIVLFLFAMCFICMILSFAWEQVIGSNFTIYLALDYYLYKEGQRDSLINAFIAFLQFFSYIILLNTVVPISLYISVEVLRFCHSLWIDCDQKMYFEKTDTAAHARTTTLNEELGQVQYIFSDKTGTLTQNIMVFKKCSINGQSYGDLINSRNEILEIREDTPQLDFSSNPWYEPNFRFYDKRLLDDTRRGVFEVHEFWRLLAICHTVMPERKSGNILEYQAQSPDEAALTSAARNFGFIFKCRTPRSITIETNGKSETYEVLHILDFDNVRKRMSVIVRMTANENEKDEGNIPIDNSLIKLYCKGADTLIFERLNKSKKSDLLKQATLQHLEKFAADGLRTLCVAYRTIDPLYCQSWMERLRKATLDVNKTFLLNELYEEIEKDMQLLGATAIEDKLQDGVSQTIERLREANIKIWILTGDKTETAINIGYSCKLLTEDMQEVFVIDGKTKHEIELQMKDIRCRIERGRSADINATNGFCDASTPATTSSDKQPVISKNNALSLPTFFYKSTRSRCCLGFMRCFPSFSPSKIISGVIPRINLQPLHVSYISGKTFYPNRGTYQMPPNITKYIYEQIESLRKMENIQENHEFLLPEPLGMSMTTPIELLSSTSIHHKTNITNEKFPPKPRRRSVFDDEIREPQLKILNRVLNDKTYNKPSLKSTNHGSTYTQWHPMIQPKVEKAAISTTSNVTTDVSHGFNNSSYENSRTNLSTYDTFALVINGSSLTHVLSKQYERIFLEIACMCTSVICCRVTPLQKAKVVELVKRHVKVITLAIGDGANDVSMIKTAHIGVGISGQEGMQAVLASDYSIGQFRYLERLLLVHGRWSYFRMSKFLRYFFYKNFSYTLTHFWYSFFCGYSAQTIFDPILMACFNMLFTALPVLAMGIFDQDVNDEYSLRYPKLYIPGQNNMFFNMRIFVYSVIHGSFTSIVIFFIPYGAYDNTSDVYGRDVGDYSLISFTAFTALVIVVTGQIMFDTSYWTIYNHLCVWGSLVLYVFVVVIIYEVVPLLHINTAAASTIVFYNVVKRAIFFPNFWFTLLLICVILLVPTLANRFLWFDTRPFYSDRLRLLYKICPLEKRLSTEEGNGTAKSKESVLPVCRSRQGLFRSGYAFSHASGFGDLISKGILFRNIEQLRISPIKQSDSREYVDSKRLKMKRKDDHAMFGKMSSINKNLSTSNAESNNIKSANSSSIQKQLNNNEIVSNLIAATYTTKSPSIIESNCHKTITSLESGTLKRQMMPVTNLQLTPKNSERHLFLVNVDNEPFPTDWSFVKNESIIELEKPLHDDSTS